MFVSRASNLLLEVPQGFRNSASCRRVGNKCKFSVTRWQIASLRAPWWIGAQCCATMCSACWGRMADQPAPKNTMPQGLPRWRLRLLALALRHSQGPQGHLLWPHPDGGGPGTVCGPAPHQQCTYRHLAGICWRAKCLNDTGDRFRAFCTPLLGVSFMDSWGRNSRGRAVLPGSLGWRWEPASSGQ